MTLNEKIGEILKRHKEGKEFFDALDYMIRSDRDILHQFYDFYFAKIASPEVNTTTYNVILSGSFGLSMITNYGKSLFYNFNRVLLVNERVYRNYL